MVAGSKTKHPQKWCQKTVDKRPKLWYLNNANGKRKYKPSDVCGSGSVVEHLLAKERVAGSIPVSRFFLFQGDVAKW
jgi:hypothetical protein